MVSDGNWFATSYKGSVPDNAKSYSAWLGDAKSYSAWLGDAKSYSAWF